MQRALTEFIGTFFIVLVSILAKNLDLGIWASIPGVAMYIALIYMGFHVSGAHYNPAISLAMLIRGRLDFRNLIFYIAMQLAGALVAATFGIYLLRSGGAHEIVIENVQEMPAFISELLGTFIIVYTALHVMTTSENRDKSFYGSAIGLATWSAILTFGKYSAAVFNPALAFGYSIIGMVEWSQIWIYLIATMLGGAIAASVFIPVYGRQD